MFAYGPGDQDSIPGRVIPKTQKMVIRAALFSTQHYKVSIKGKVEQFSVVAIDTGAYGSPSNKVAQADRYDTKIAWDYVYANLWHYSIIVLIVECID